MTKFAVKDLVGVSLIFGMQVSRDRLKGTLNLNQGNYVDAILQRYGFVDSRSVSTPGTGKPLDLNSEPCWTIATSSYTEKMWGISSINRRVNAGTLPTP